MIVLSGPNFTNRDHGNYRVDPETASNPSVVLYYRLRLASLVCGLHPAVMTFDEFKYIESRTAAQLRGVKSTVRDTTMHQLFSVPSVRCAGCPHSCLHF